MFTSSLLNPDRTPSKQKAFLVGVQFDKLHTYRIPRRDRRRPAENPAPEGRPNIAQRRGPQHARFWRDGVEGFSAGESRRNDSSPGGTTESSRRFFGRCDERKVSPACLRTRRVLAITDSAVVSCNKFSGPAFIRVVLKNNSGRQS